jgi:osmotically-inducible protein OsmY
MAGSRHCPRGPHLAATLGAALLVGPPPLVAQAISAGSKLEEVVITARREADAALTARVLQVLQDDPYVFADHIEVVTENGIVRLQGIALDYGDLQRTLLLARRVAGRRRVVNEIEVITGLDQ